MQTETTAMKKYLLIAAFLFISHLLLAQPKIPVDSAAFYVGKKVTVCSEVYEVKSTDKITFINLGKAYPNSPLTIVIFAKDRASFSETPEKLYGNKPICVTGIIKEYKDKAEIVVNTQDEISFQ